MQKSWINNRIHTPYSNNKNVPIISATKFFNQLSFIGDEFVGCFLLETHKGLILFDCINQDEKSVSIIEKGISDLRKNIEQLYAIIISHDYSDYFGKAYYFQKSMLPIYNMSKIDHEFAKSVPPKTNWQPINFTVNHFLSNDKIFDFGIIQVNSIFTPRHTSECFSFLIPVTDEG